LPSSANVSCANLSKRKLDVLEKRVFRGKMRGFLWVREFGMGEIIEFS